MESRKGKMYSLHTLIINLIIPPDMPFDFKRLRFSIRLSFSIAINKAKVQSLQMWRSNAENPFFHMASCVLHADEPDIQEIYLFLLKDRKTNNILLIPFFISFVIKRKINYS